VLWRRRKAKPTGSASIHAQIYYDKQKSPGAWSSLGAKAGALEYGGTGKRSKVKAFGRLDRVFASSDEPA
jgi:hypothetical protein